MQVEEISHAIGNKKRLKRGWKFNLRKRRNWL